ncbi:MAG: hypothetical protein GY866_39980 [Proteobacteria bacterium]|nr:hypothetical protein [Pseudomonadota bacterium]
MRKTFETPGIGLWFKRLLKKIENCCAVAAPAEEDCRELAIQYLENKNRSDRSLLRLFGKKTEYREARGNHAQASA